MTVSKENGIQLTVKNQKVLTKSTGNVRLLK